MTENKETKLSKENDKLASRVKELENLFNNVTSLIISLDQTGIIVECNNQIKRILGYDKNEIIGQLINKIIHPDYIEKVHKLLSDVQKTGNALYKELKMIKKDGSLIDVNISFSGINKNGDIYERTICTIDVLVRNVVEQQHLENEERYIALFENAPLAYQSLNENGYFTDINPAWLRTLGYKRDEVIGKSFSDFLHEDWKEHFKQNFPEFKNRGYINDVQFKIKHKNSEYRDVAYQGRIGYNLDGSFKQTHCVFQDITETKKATEELETAYQQLQASNQQLAASEQQMKAYNQQLAANEQQLRATNQQLRASEQQLKSTNQKLSISETKLRKIIDNSPFPIAVVNSVGDKILLWSESATKVFGHTVSKMQEWFDLSYPDPNYQAQVIERWDAQVDIALSTKQPVNTGEYYITCEDGKVRLCELYATFIEDELVVTFNDITHRKEFEEEIIKAKEKAETSEKRYKDLINNLGAGVIVHAPDTSIIINNKKTSELLGLSDDQLKGKLAYNSEWHFTDIDDNIIDTKDYPVNIINRTREPISDYIVGVNRPDTKDKVWLIINGFPVIDSFGKVSEIVISFIDFTARRNAEEELIKAKEKVEVSKKFLDNIIDNIGDPFFVKNDQSQLLFVNEAFCKSFDLPKEMIIGRTLAEDVSPEEREHFLRIDKQVLSDGVEDISEETMTVRGGKTRIVATRKTRFVDKNGKKYLIGVVRDITRRKEIEFELREAKEKAEESDRLKSAFLANMSHEIRTPMNGILGFTELLKEQGLTGEQQANYIDIIQKSGDRMLNTVNDIIEISKIETGQIKENIDIVNINVQIQYLYNFFKPEAKKKGLNLILEDTVNNEGVLLKTDSSKLNSILGNLIKNAIKYTKSGWVRIGYKRKEDMLVFCVSDSGIGIKQDRQAAIFERFVQADIEDKMALQGSGLGLAIAKSYVEMLGGKIWLDSEEHKGSSFYFTLPFQEVDTIKQPEATIESLLKNETHKKIKVLIAEDNQFSYLHLSIIMRDFASEILHATNGSIAVDIIKNNPDIDLVLMDIKMPIMDGFEALNEIRKFNKTIKIVAQTAYALEGDRDKALDSGFDDYISKPIDIKKLKKIILKIANVK